MTSYFSVDRRGFYEPGGTLDLWRNDPAINRPFVETFPGGFSVSDLDQHLGDIFPEGLSLHGWEWAKFRSQWVIHNGHHYAHNIRSIELIFEYVRRARFSHLPSRWQCYYGWEDLSAAIDFRDKQPEPFKIYEIEADVTLRLDERWLTTGEQNIAGSLFAERYWSGEASPLPNWEILLAAPVRVLR